jgi:ribonuclease HI
MMIVPVNYGLKHPVGIVSIPSLIKPFDWGTHVDTWYMMLRKVAGKLDAVVDGSYKQGSSTIGWGVILNGAHWCNTVTVPLFNRKASNNVAEYHALYECLCRVDDNAGLTIGTDSMLVAKQLSGEFAVRSTNVFPYYMEVKRLLKKTGCKVVYIPREINDADALTR